MITELVNFKSLETTTDEQLISKVDSLNNFQQKQDGYIDCELVKKIDDNSWCLIYHYESMEKVKVLGQNLRASKEFGEFVAHTVPGSVSITFFNMLKKW